MTRQKFLDELRIALQGKMDQGQINEHILYYDNYIMEESRKERSEQQVIEELGEPRLIAKTLIDTTDEFGHHTDEDFYTDDQMKNQKKGKGVHGSHNERGGFDIHYGNFKLNSWYGKLFLILILILFLVIIANVVAFLVPIVLPVILILLFLSLVFRNRR